MPRAPAALTGLITLLLMAAAVLGWIAGEIAGAFRELFEMRRRG